MKFPTEKFGALSFGNRLMYIELAHVFLFYLLARVSTYVGHPFVITDTGLSKNGLDKGFQNGQTNSRLIIILVIIMMMGCN